ncbi:hypothetical protein Y032_0078g1194 [Ancylostoma ceylanicum]|uniref:Uncharacterized protein n=1 Tax=Ancylostoma ceylanicum TaxID=53326 RepID=A0A016TTK7_9BILA|nr:hypothetical protein Y032_0078g1194 [Ancylostoma ceylanicum]
MWFVLAGEAQLYTRALSAKCATESTPLDWHFSLDEDENFELEYWQERLNAASSDPDDELAPMEKRQGAIAPNLSLLRPPANIGGNTSGYGRYKRRRRNVENTYKAIQNRSIWHRRNDFPSKRTMVRRDTPPPDQHASSRPVAEYRQRGPMVRGCGCYGNKETVRESWDQKVIAPCLQERRHHTSPGRRRPHGISTKKRAMGKLPLYEAVHCALRYHTRWPSRSHRIAPTCLALSHSPHVHCPLVYLHHFLFFTRRHDMVTFHFDNLTSYQATCSTYMILSRLPISDIVKDICIQPSIHHVHYVDTKLIEFVSFKVALTGPRFFIFNIRLL